MSTARGRRDACTEACAASEGRSWRLAGLRAPREVVVDRPEHGPAPAVGLLVPAQRLEIVPVERPEQADHLPGAKLVVLGHPRRVRGRPPPGGAPAGRESAL